MRLTRTVPALAIAATLVLTGCGTRADDAEIRAGAGDSGLVTLSQETLDKLREATGGSGVVPGAPSVGVPTGVVDAGTLTPGASGTNTAPAGAPPGAAASTAAWAAAARPSTLV